MIPTRFEMLGFAKPIYQRLIKERNAVYSEKAPAALPLNPTYVRICILFSKPRLIIKLTL